MDQKTFETGAEIRAAVLGQEHVDRSLRSSDAFVQPFQEFLTEYCWGAVWGRDGLSHKTRSMLNLAMLSALNRHHEFKAHVKGALKNGVTKQEITEVLLQVAIYCGVPAGVEHFRLAREAFKEAGVG